MNPSIEINGKIISHGRIYLKFYREVIIMGINWISIGVNAFISLLMSFIVFSLGLRAGKERTERKGLREKYRGLTVHFEELHNKIIEDEPLSWSDFDIDHFSKVSMPPLRKMTKDGEHLELDQEIITNLEDLEVIALRYGKYFNDIELEAGNIILKELEQKGVDLEYSSNSNSKTTRVSTDNTNNSYIRYKPAKLIFKNRIDELLQKLEQMDTGVNFELVQRSKIVYSVHIRKQDIEMLDFKEIMERISNELNQIKNEEINRKTVIINKHKEYIDILKQKTKEPYSFWDTLKNTFKDFIR